MKNTTLCYIEKDGCYLLLHRIKKENDLNRDKWIGIGGKFEEDESPEECLLREAKRSFSTHSSFPSSQSRSVPVKPVAWNRCIYSPSH